MRQRKKSFNTRIRHKNREPRERVPFIELLRNGTDYFVQSKRINGEFVEVEQIRIGTSYHNSFAVPVDQVDVLLQHLEEIKGVLPEKLAELRDRHVMRNKNKESENQ